MNYVMWLKCEMCESSFQTNKGLKNHVSSVHKGKKPLLKCVICNEFFTGQDALIKHVASVHEEYSKGPEGFHGIISDTYNTIDKFDFREIDDKDVIYDMKFIIQMVQDGKEKFKCEHCGKNFFEKANLYKHLAKNHEESFTTGNNLKTHVKSVHERNKPFKCSVCQKNFATKGSLSKHNVHHVKKDSVFWDEPSK